MKQHSSRKRQSTPKKQKARTALLHAAERDTPQSFGSLYIVCRCDPGGDGAKHSLSPPARCDNKSPMVRDRVTISLWMNGNLGSDVIHTQEVILRDRGI